MAKRISLREFQESLVRRLAEAQTGQRRALLGVEAGGENWLIELAETGEILPVPALTPVPLTHAWFCGVANIRGTLFGVVDFSAFHQGATTTPAGQARLLLVGSRFGVNDALLVTRALGLRNPEDFEPDDGPPDPRPWVAQRLLDTRGKPWLKLDVQRLLAHPGFLDASIE
jgi:twitching motility protein PilI